MNRTLHYGLPLFEATDKPSILVDWNETMADLDQTLFTIATGGDSSVADAITALQQAVASINSQITVINQTLGDTLDVTFMNNIAPQFETTGVEYNPKDMVFHNGNLYICFAQYTGAQDDEEHFDQYFIPVWLANKVTDNLNDVDSLKSRMTSAESGISANTSDISSLDTRVDALENATSVPEFDRIDFYEFLNKYCYQPTMVTKTLDHAFRPIKANHVPSNTNGNGFYYWDYYLKQIDAINVSVDFSNDLANNGLYIILPFKTLCDPDYDMLRVKIMQTSGTPAGFVSPLCDGSHKPNESLDEGVCLSKAIKQVNGSDVEMPDEVGIFVNTSVKYSKDPNDMSFFYANLKVSTIYPTEKIKPYVPMVFTRDVATGKLKYQGFVKKDNANLYFTQSSNGPSGRMLTFQSVTTNSTTTDTNFSDISSLPFFIYEVKSEYKDLFITD